MNITISTEEIIDQMKAEISSLYHALMLEKMTVARLAMRLDKYDSEESQEVPPAAPVRRMSALAEVAAGIEQ